MSEEYKITLRTEINSGQIKVLNHVIGPVAKQSIVTARDGDFMVIDIESEEIKPLFEEKFGDIWGGALSYNGSAAVTVAAPFQYGGGDPSRWHIGVWDLYAGKLVTTIGIDQYNYHSAASPDLRVVMIANSSSINWWDIEKEKRLGSVKNPHGTKTWKIAVSKDGKTAASSSVDIVCLWNTESGKMTKEIPVPKKKLFQKPKRFSAIRFGNEHIYISSDEGKLYIAELNGEMHEMIIDTGHNAWTYQFDIHEQAKLAAMLVYGHPLEIWDTFSGKMVASVEVPQSQDVTDIRFSEDAEKLIIANKEGIAKIWDVIKQ